MIMIVLFVASVVAFCVSTVSGGGAGLMLMPVLATVVAAPQVPAALSIGAGVSSVARIASFRHAIRWDVVRWFVPAAIPATALGAWALSRFEPIYVQFLLGAFLTANLPLLLTRPIGEATSTASLASPRLLSAIGAAAGLLSGFTGAVGLAFNGFYFQLGLSKTEIVATRAMNEVLLHVLKIGLYAALGLLTARAIYAGGVLAIGAIAASLLMRGLLPRIDEALFRRAGLAAMAVAGIAMLANTGPIIAARNNAGMRYAATPDERELRAFWGAHRYSVEVNARDGLVFEKRLRWSHLPPAIRVEITARAAAARAQVADVEKELHLGGRMLEVFYQRDGRRWSETLPYRG